MWRIVVQGLLDLIWPPRTDCLLCTEPLAEAVGIVSPVVCQACWTAMAFPPLARRCGNCARPMADPAALCADCQAGSPFGQVFALGLHEGPLREAIHHFKFEGRDDLGRPLGQRLGASIPPGHDLIVPVPLHRTRFVERGYNQASLVSHGIGRATGLPVVENALRRVRDTGHQAKLDRASRLQNLTDAFAAPRQRAPWKGRRVLLVDDVLTTGATAAAATAVLRGTGAANVSLAVLAVSTTPVQGNLKNSH